MIEYFHIKELPCLHKDFSYRFICMTWINFT